MRATPSIYRSPDTEAKLATIYDARLAKWPLPYDSLTVTTRYGRTHIIATGPREAPPLLLLHVLTVPSFMWRANIAALARDHRTYAVDTIGDLGKSVLEDLDRHPEGGESYSQWLADVSDGLGVGGADVIGASMGGWIALHHAIHAPERVKRMVLIGPMGLPSWWVSLNAVLRLTSTTLFGGQRSMAGLIRWALGSGAHVHDEVAEYMATAMGSRPRVAAPFPVSTERLGRIEAPTLVLLGERDGPIGKAASVAKRAERHIRDVEVRIIPNACHVMSIEYPDVVNERVLDFLRSPSATA